MYGRGDTLVVADASESIDGEPLFVKLVDQGRVVYAEDFRDQAARADRTWGRYSRWEAVAAGGGPPRPLQRDAGGGSRGGPGAAW